jgi:ribosomal protein L19
VLPHLVDGKNPVADEVGLGSGELRENETGAIAEEDVGGEADGLEVLGLSGSRRDRDLLLADEGVDGRRLSDVGVSDESDDHALRGVTVGDRDCESRDRKSARLLVHQLEERKNSLSGACLRKRSSNSSTERILVRSSSSEPGVEIPAPLLILLARSPSVSLSLSSSLKSSSSLSDSGSSLGFDLPCEGPGALSLLPDLGTFMPVTLR